MALTDIIAAVGEQLDDSIDVKVGKKNLNANGAPPRIIWVPTQDRFAPTQRVGGNAKAILTRKAGVEVHCWGADFAATEDLINQALVAIYAAVVKLPAALIMPQGFRILDDAGWLANAWTNNGEVYVFHAEFHLPVTTAPAPTAKVTALPITPELETPGNPPTEEDD